jgi:hypothetical protein
VLTRDCSNFAASYKLIGGCLDEDISRLVLCLGRLWDLVVDHPSFATLLLHRSSLRTIHELVLDVFKLDCALIRLSCVSRAGAG